MLAIKFIVGRTREVKLFNGITFAHSLRGELRRIPAVVCLCLVLRKSSQDTHLDDYQSSTNSLFFYYSFALRANRSVIRPSSGGFLRYRRLRPFCPLPSTVLKHGLLHYTKGI